MEQETKKPRKNQQFPRLSPVDDTELEKSSKSQGKSAKRRRRGDVGGDQPLKADSLSPIQPKPDGAAADLWAAIARSVCQWFNDLDSPSRDDLAALIEQLRRL